MKKRWRRAPRQILRRDLEHRRLHPLAKELAMFVEGMTKALNALAQGCVTLRDAFYLALLDHMQRR